MPKLNIDYPYWKTLVWRLVRGAVASAVAQTVALQVDWTKPEEAVRTLVVSFVAGFLLALSKGIRDEWGGRDKGTLLHKLPL